MHFFAIGSIVLLSEVNSEKAPALSSVPQDTVLAPYPSASILKILLWY